MLVQGSRVAVIGGSIAGCAAYLALSRAGCDVDIYERSSGQLRDRGSGIAIPLALRDELTAAGYLPADYPSCYRSRRWWIVADGSDDGRIAWEQPGEAALNNWGVLWRSLRRNVPDDRYHDATELASFRVTDDGVRLRTTDGVDRDVDLIVGADGYRSEVRSHLLPASRPSYAGYVLWRGNFVEKRVAGAAIIDRADAAEAWFTVGFAGGHGVMYLIPNFDDRTDPGHRRVNWAIYAPQPPGLVFEEPTSIPPGEVTADLYQHLDDILEAHFPPALRDVIRASPPEEVSIQPIYDELVDTYTSDRVLLIGDAGTVSRPHTGSGATKALQDALALEGLATEHDEWSEVLAAYDAERVTVGRSTVELGQRLGRAQVEQTPAWDQMTPEDFDAWTKAALAGESLYFYGNAEQNTD